ncbi:MAG: hypothetical protein KF773_24870 [Deltaproteobacteria bacterium]|nr:hypothetical protein [Deltaproteobacteria bacterium]MCW5804504.1 hypothetical protein [Deltaproteobacteria bacterium]
MSCLLPVAVAVAVAAACGDNLEGDAPIDPSGAATFRGYAAVQEDLYAAFIAPQTPFELHRYLGESGEALSRLVGRPDGFGVTYDARNARPNGMNVLIWRMLLSRFANDLAAKCAGSVIVDGVDPQIELHERAHAVVDAMCTWPPASDATLREAWDLAIGYLAPVAARDAWIRLAHDPELAALDRDRGLPSLWLAAFLHPSFLLEQ